MYFHQPNIQIMIADFADVFFQSNPSLIERLNGASVLSTSFIPGALSQHFRCPFNSGWIKACYGIEQLNKIGANPVICSGIVMGTRDTLLAYTGLVVAHLDSKVRLGNGTVKSDPNGCASWEWIKV